MTLLASGYELLEGPVVDASGDLYFSDLFSGVHCLRTDGRTEVVIPGRKMVGGICLHDDGGLVVSGPDLLHLRDGIERTLLDLDDVGSRSGARAVGFNDIEADRDGNLFVGLLRRDAADKLVPGELLWVTGEHEYAVLLDDVHPNGAALSPDGSLLYVADTLRRRLVVLAVHGGRAPTLLTSMSTRSIPGLPDGMVTDVEGCLWVAFYRGGCVARFTPDGEVERVFETASPHALSLCHGGVDRTDLYIVTGRSEDKPDISGGVYRMRVDVPGNPVARVRV